MEKIITLSSKPDFLKMERLSSRSQTPDFGSDLRLLSGWQGWSAFLLGTFSCNLVPWLLRKVGLQVQQERESVPFVFTGRYAGSKKKQRCFI